MSTLRGHGLAEAHDLAVVGGEVGLGAAWPAPSCGRARSSARCSCLAELSLGARRLLALGREQQEPVGGQDARSARAAKSDLAVAVGEGHDPPPSEAGTRSDPRGASLAGAAGSKRDRHVELVVSAAAVDASRRRRSAARGRLVQLDVGRRGTSRRSRTISVAMSDCLGVQPTNVAVGPGGARRPVAAAAAAAPGRGRVAGGGGFGGLEPAAAPA